MTFCPLCDWIITGSQYVDLLASGLPKGQGKQEICIFILYCREGKHREFTKTTKNIIYTGNVHPIQEVLKITLMEWGGSPWATCFLHCIYQYFTTLMGLYPPAASCIETIWKFLVFQLIEIAWLFKWDFEKFGLNGITYDIALLSH